MEGLIPESEDSDNNSVSSYDKTIPNVPPLSLVIEKINSQTFEILTPAASSPYGSSQSSTADKPLSPIQKILPPIPVSKPKRYVDEFGFYLDTSDSVAVNHFQKSKEKIKELQQRENEWLSYINNWDELANKKKSRVKVN
jgi:hypothetical protein